MRLVRSVACAVLLSAVLTEPSGAQIADQFVVPLNEALRSVALSISDLTFRTDMVERDSFRLSRTDAFATSPLSFADSLAALDETASRFTQPAEFLAHSYAWLDTPIRRSNSPAPDQLVRDTSRTARAFNALAGTLKWAALVMRDAGASFSAAERESLSVWSDELLSDGDDVVSGAQVNIYELRRNEIRELERARAYLSAASRWDRVAVATAAHTVAVAAWELRNALRADILSGRSPLPVRTWNTPYGRVAVGGKANDRYSGNYALIVNLGGSDEYRLAPTGLSGAPVQVVIDCTGDDNYRGGIAGAAFGISMLLDLAGDDTYRGDSWTQGSARFGAGLLWDEAGNDTYTAVRAAQGAAAFGVGLLVDAGGSDIYRVGSYGQGLGATGGFGLIEERGGHDSYLAGGLVTDVLRYDDHYLTMAQGVGLGVRPVGSGGFGFVFDRNGNDVYSADIFGQGVGYWLGCGGLVDGAGHDRFIAYQYAQGAGVHFASGALLDYAGNDVYASNGVSQGCGHDLGFGILFDRGGDDSYVTEGLSLGAGNANGISLMVDMSGRDAYVARRNDVLGYSDRRREYGMIGVMLDLGGEDRYAAPVGSDGGWWVQSTYGVGTDREAAALQTEATRPDGVPDKSADAILLELATSAESLFVQASNPIASYQYLVEPAEQRLVDHHSSAVPFWAGKLSSESARERWALIRIHQKLFAKGDTSTVPMLLDSLRSRSGPVCRMSAHLLGYSATSSAVPPLLELLSSPEWKTRQAAAESLWRLKDTQAEHSLTVVLADSIELVRHSAAMALETCGTEYSEPALVSALSDTSQIVRHSAEQALKKHTNARSLIRYVAEHDTGFAVFHALRILRTDTTDTSYAPILASLLNGGQHWSVRAEAANSVAGLRITHLLPDLQRARAATDQPYLVLRLDAAIAALTQNKGRQR
jgi:HEAT repeat protein